jgi:Protein of unknown function, DUF488
MQIKTASWFTDLPEGHTRIGISRGTPHRHQPDYRTYRKLAPGPWFNRVSDEEFYHRYRKEILGPLDPRLVADELFALARGGIPVLLCYEKTGGPVWCHRALAAEWLAEALGHPVPEVGFETLSQHGHPLWPAGLRRAVFED